MRAFAFAALLLAAVLFPCAAMATPSGLFQTTYSGTEFVFMANEISGATIGSTAYCNNYNGSTSSLGCTLTTHNGDLILGIGATNGIATNWTCTNAGARNTLILDNTNTPEFYGFYWVASSTSSACTFTTTASAAMGMAMADYTGSSPALAQSCIGSIAASSCTFSTVPTSGDIISTLATSLAGSQACGTPKFYDSTYVALTQETCATGPSAVFDYTFGSGTPAFTALVPSQACAQSGTTCVFGSAPATNSEVVGGEVGAPSSGACEGVSDSNSVALTQRYSQVTGSVEVCGYDYKVPGTPTATYTCGSGASCGLLNVTGAAIPGTYATNSAVNTSPTTATVTTKPGDLLVCTGQSSFLPTYASTAFSGGTTLSSTYVLNGYGSGSGALLYAIASGTSASCTTTNGNNSNGTIFVGLADYTPPPVTSGCGPYPTPCVFQAAEARRRKLTLADLLR